MHESEGPGLLEHFHTILIEEISDRRPEYLQSPFTVAEIYQSLIPYRTHRDRLGVEMNGDYEHVILRLLSGEGEFLHLESDVARKEIAEELDSPDPDTSVFREFAAVDVRLNPDRIPAEATPLPDAVDDTSPEEGAEDTTDTEEAGEVTEEEGSDSLELEFAGEESADSASESTPSTTEPETTMDEQDACPWCSESLPARPDMKYCPHCGEGLSHRPCTNCGAVLELGWKFCVDCGTPVDA